MRRALPALALPTLTLIALAVPSARAEETPPLVALLQAVLPEGAEIAFDPSQDSGAVANLHITTPALDLAAGSARLADGALTLGELRITLADAGVEATATQLEIARLDAAGRQAEGIRAEGLAIGLAGRLVSLSAQTATLDRLTAEAAAGLALSGVGALYRQERELNVVTAERLAAGRLELDPLLALAALPSMERLPELLESVHLPDLAVDGIKVSWESGTHMLVELATLRLDGLAGATAASLDLAGLSLRSFGLPINRLEAAHIAIDDADLSWLLPGTEVPEGTGLLGKAEVEAEGLFVDQRRGQDFRIDRLSLLTLPREAGREAEERWRLALDLAIPADQFRDEETLELLDRLALPELPFAMGFDLAISADGTTWRYDPMWLRVGDVGSLELTMTVGNGAAPLEDTRLEAAQLAYTDRGLVREWVSIWAGRTYRNDPALFARDMVQSFRFQAMRENAPTDVFEALEAFLTDPGTIVLTAVPATPPRFGEVMAAGPGDIIRLLNLSAELR